MSKKVLLADDSVTIQKVVEIILADGDYNLLVADNGEAALNMLLTERPDIILADVYMPGKNGYELCAAVKQDASLAGVPVLLLSGTFEPFDESKALAAGADGWIAKPFESQALLEQIEELLARPAVAAASSAVDAAGVVEEAAAVAEPDMWADLDVDTLGEEEGEQVLADVPSADTSGFDEVELETDGLWDEEPLPVEDEQTLELSGEDVDLGALDFAELSETDLESEVPGPAAEGLDAAEEEVLFLDESDLLIEEDTEDVAKEEEETFEFVTIEESAPEAAAEAIEESFGFEADTVDQPEEAEETVGLEVAEEAAGLEVFEETAPAVSEEVEDIFPEPEAVEEPEPAEEPEAAPEPEPVAEPVAPEASGLSYFRSEGLISRLADNKVAEPAPEDEPVASEGSGLSFFRSRAQSPTSAVTQEAVPAPVAEPEVSAAVAEPLTEEIVTERVQGLSEEELTAIVEQVAGKVIERLASTMLERIAWEVVPDLAESLIKEEISRITAGRD